MRHPSSPSRCGSPGSAFSLIELLIVVTVIAILAAIALPNFLEAQTRAKVARTKSDMRALIQAVEHFHVDHNEYPFRRGTDSFLGINPLVPERDTRLPQMEVLTKPVQYLSSLPVDVFEELIFPPNNVIDYYDSVQITWLINSRKRQGDPARVAPSDVSWMLLSVGPDGYLGNLSSRPGWPTSPLLFGSIYVAYDPTNGSISPGNIYASGDGGIDQGGSVFMKRVFSR